MFTSWLSHIHIQQWMWLKLSWIPTGVEAKFWVHLTILKQMWLTGVWKCTWGVWLVKDPRLGCIGCLWLNGGLTLPYQAVYGQVPPSHIHYIPGSSNIGTVDQWGFDRETTLKLLKDHLLQAQNRMKQMADQHRTEREFQVGDWVYLRLQPYKQSTLQCRSNMKLSPRFYGPFQVLKWIRKVAYHLNLPSNSKLHPVFQVSLLKKKLGGSTLPQPTLLELSLPNLWLWLIDVWSNTKTTSYSGPCSMVLFLFKGFHLGIL